jgi:hypothetical protein
VVDELGEILPALEEGIQARKESTLAC